MRYNELTVSTAIKRVPLRKLEQRLAEARARSTGDPGQLAELQATQTRISALSARAESLEAELALGLGREQKDDSEVSFR